MRWMLPSGSPDMVVVAVMMLGGLSGAAAQASSESGPSALLATGSKGDFRWKVLVHRDDGVRGGRRPCIEASVGRRGAAGAVNGVLTLCGAIAPWPILLANSTGSGVKERTVFAMVYTPRVAAVRLWLQGRRSRRIQLQLLSEGKSEKPTSDVLDMQSSEWPAGFASVASRHSTPEAK